MAIFRIEYTNLTGSVGWNAGDFILFNGVMASGYILTSQASGVIPSAGVILISSSQTPTLAGIIYPTGNILQTSATISAYSTLTEQQTVTIRDPGAKFNISLKNPNLTNAYWGIRVTVQ